jgi:DNA-binding winged helix-turn-helix (wHTH) protein
MAIDPPLKTGGPVCSDTARRGVYSGRELMPQPSPSPAVLRFDVYTLNLRTSELYRYERKVKLQEQPLQILAMLLEHPGELVTREELRQSLWSEDTFVDFEHSLNTAIKKLRRALNDEADSPRFVETLPRHGYRFIGSVPESSRLSPPLSSAVPKGMVGRVLVLQDKSGGDFVSLAVDELALREKQKLEAAADDLGLSLLYAAEKVLAVQTGTKVKVLEDRPEQSYFEVRILEGEHTAKIAIVPGNYLV